MNLSLSHTHTHTQGGLPLQGMDSLTQLRKIAQGGFPSQETGGDDIDEDEVPSEYPLTPPTSVWTCSLQTFSCRSRRKFWWTLKIRGVTCRLPHPKPTSWCRHVLYTVCINEHLFTACVLLNVLNGLLLDRLVIMNLARGKCPKRGFGNRNKLYNYSGCKVNCTRRDHYCSPFLHLPPLLFAVSACCSP